VKDATSGVVYYSVGAARALPEAPLAGAPSSLSLVVAFTITAPPGGSPPAGLSNTVAAPNFSSALGSGLSAAGFTGAAVGSLAAVIPPGGASAAPPPPLELLGLAALLALGPLGWWVWYRKAPRSGWCCRGCGGENRAAAAAGGGPSEKGDAAAVAITSDAVHTAVVLREPEPQPNELCVPCPPSAVACLVSSPLTPPSPPSFRKH
jgi:hypothetical protein